MTGAAPAILVQLRRKAKETGRTVSETIQYYAMERFLYRIGASQYKDAFILKGAMMLRAWDVRSARSTRDIDLLAYLSNDLDKIRHILSEICELDGDSDGVKFDASSIRMELIKEFDDYQGARAKFSARLESAVIPMQLDIGFGDVVYPESVWAEFPTVLESTPPRVRMYPRSSVVAEKLHAMAKLGAINSRMKDYHDIWFLSMQESFDFNELTAAIQATFDARRTRVPDNLDGLSDAYVVGHESMWKAFLQREPEIAKMDLATTILRLRAFLLPCLVSKPLSHASRSIWFPAEGAWKQPPGVTDP